MEVLAIDYGSAKIGLAIGDTITRLAEPLVVIKHKGVSDALAKLSKLYEFERALKVIVGLSSGTNDEEACKIGELIREKFDKEIIFWDEKYSTIDAISKSIEAGHGPKKRRNMEDAYAAAQILNNYFEGTA